MIDLESTHFLRIYTIHSNMGATAAPFLSRVSQEKHSKWTRCEWVDFIGHLGED